jgi:hypothetical protein
MTHFCSCRNVNNNASMPASPSPQDFVTAGVKLILFNVSIRPNKEYRAIKRNDVLVSGVVSSPSSSSSSSSSSSTTVCTGV